MMRDPPEAPIPAPAPASAVPETLDVAVIGAGGAGLLAGIAAARAGARTVVFERMKRPGKKVAISGGGRCNFTNTLDPRQFIRLFGDPNAVHLGHALRAFSRDDLVELLGQHGIEGEVERGYRLYTKSGKGFEVVEAFERELSSAGGSLRLQARILSIRPAGRIQEMEVEEAGAVRRIDARAIVVATGGLSYPATGSSGDGYAWARSLGHGITALRPALVGLAVEEDWPRKLQGLAWEDAEVTLRPAPPPAEGPPAPGQQQQQPPAPKPLCAERAEILFTHFGISGPAILDVSNAFVRSGLSRAVLTIDFLPDQDREALDGLLLERFRNHPNRTAANALEGLLPGRLLDWMESTLGEGAGTPVCRLSRAARQDLLDRMKATALTIQGTRGIEYGEVTAGGIVWDGIEPATMESRRAPGIFFAGEILDVTGRCGGFNLQAAFSTGWLAGCSAAGYALRA